jgi:hypothetical protein
MNTPAKLGRGVFQVLECFRKYDREIVKVLWPTVGQNRFRLAPDTLVGIQFGSVGREIHEVKSRKLETELLDFFALVGFAVVQDDEDMAPQMLQEVAKKLANFRSLNVFAM